jgi:ADP-ribose pyrophosphatase YjhB (NUDIX family)
VTEPSSVRGPEGPIGYRLSSPDVTAAPPPEPGGLLPIEDYVAALVLKRMAAGALFRDDADRVLWVEPTYKPVWEIPGGGVEADESPWDCAVREVAEEIGLHRPLGRLLVVDHVRAHGPMPEGMMFVFDGGRLDQAEVDALVLDTRELRSAALMGVDEARPRVAPRLADRMASALAALHEGTTALCDDGVRVA